MLVEPVRGDRAREAGGVPLMLVEGARGDRTRHVKVADRERRRDVQAGDDRQREDGREIEGLASHLEFLRVGADLSESPITMRTVPEWPLHGV